MVEKNASFLEAAFDWVDITCNLPNETLDSMAGLQFPDPVLCRGWQMLIGPI